MAPRSTPMTTTVPAGRGAGCEVGATTESLGRTTVLRLHGTLRAATAHAVRELVDDALEASPAVLVLDLADLVAGDDLGLWVLPAMSGDAARRGVRLVVAAPGRPLRLRLRRLGGHALEITDVVPAPAG